RISDFGLWILDIRFGISISWLVVFFRGGRFGDFIKQLGYFFLFLAEGIELALFAVVEFSRAGMLLAEGFRTLVDVLLKRAEDFKLGDVRNIVGIAALAAALAAFTASALLIPRSAH